MCDLFYKTFTSAVLNCDYKSCQKPAKAISHNTECIDYALVPLVTFNTEGVQNIF